MLIDRYPVEDIFAHVPQMIARIDPVLQQLDRLLDDDALYQRVRDDFSKRHRYTLVHGRHSSPVEVLLRLVLLKHLYQWSYQETEDQVDQNLILRWFCRVYFQSIQAQLLNRRAFIAPKAARSWKAGWRSEIAARRRPAEAVPHGWGGEA